MKNFFKKMSIFILCLLLLVYALLWWYSRKTYPIEYGISFNQDYATALGLDWKKTYVDMLDDLRPKYIRIAAMWNDVEPASKSFDFTRVDFLMQEAALRNVKVILVVGQKAPRWPECHVPEWYHQLASDQRDTAVLQYIQTVVERYRLHPALETWQVENEPYIRFAFGTCSNYNVSAVAKEISLVKKLDTLHQVIVTDSGELSTWYRAIKAGDLFGTTLYRVVQTPGGIYVYYDWVPATFYRWKATILGRPVSEMYIAELQAEPWFAKGNPLTISLSEQFKSMSIVRLQKHMEYVTHIGSPRAYLWGVEWWAWLKQTQQHPEFWNMVKERIAATNT